MKHPTPLLVPLVRDGIEGDIDFLADEVWWYL